MLSKSIFTSCSPFELGINQFGVLLVSIDTRLAKIRLNGLTTIQDKQKILRNKYRAHIWIIDFPDKSVFLEATRTTLGKGFAAAASCLSLFLKYLAINFFLSNGILHSDYSEHFRKYKNTHLTRFRDELGAKRLHIRLHDGFVSRSFSRRSFQTNALIYISYLSLLSNFRDKDETDVRKPQVFVGGET